MKAKIAFLAMLCAVSLAGCASQSVWTKPGSTQAQFSQDKAQCEMRGQQAEASTIGYNGFLAGYEHATTAKLCMQAHGWALGSKTAAQDANRSRIVWVKDPGYSYKQAHTDFAQCKKWNPDESGTADCMQKKGYVGVTDGALFDAAKKALAAGTISKSVSSEAESDARREKVIHLVLSTRQ